MAREFGTRVHHIGEKHGPSKARRVGSGESPRGDVLSFIDVDVTVCGEVNKYRPWAVDGQAALGALMDSSHDSPSGAGFGNGRSAIRRHVCHERLAIEDIQLRHRLKRGPALAAAMYDALVPACRSQSIRFGSGVYFRWPRAHAWGCVGSPQPGRELGGDTSTQPQADDWGSKKCCELVRLVLQVGTRAGFIG